MIGGNEKLSGADFGHGISLASIEDRTLLLAHAHGKPVILVRRGDLVQAVDAQELWRAAAQFARPLSGGYSYCDFARFCRNRGVTSGEVAQQRRNAPIPIELFGTGKRAGPRRIALSSPAVGHGPCR